MKIVSGLLMKSMLINISRVILALYFLLPGISKFMFWNMHIELMETHNMIMAPFFLAITGTAQVVGSIFLIFIDIYSLSGGGEHCDSVFLQNYSTRYYTATIMIHSDTLCVNTSVI